MSEFNTMDVGEKPDKLSEDEKIAIMKVFFDEFNKRRSRGENAPYACFMAERERLVTYNALINKKA
jgi:hypothetical protein